MNSNPIPDPMVLGASFPPFLEKLQQLVKTCEPEYGYWSENGRKFIVCSDEFETKVLKKYFKGSLKTFIRQLHFYCFKKSEAVGGKWSFCHPNFQRDRPDLARLIKRKTRLNSTAFASKIELDALRTVVYDFKATVEAELHSVRAQLGSIFKILNDLQRNPDASKISHNSGTNQSDSSSSSLSRRHKINRQQQQQVPFYQMQQPPGNFQFGANSMSNAAANMIHFQNAAMQARAGNGNFMMTPPMRMWPNYPVSPVTPTLPQQVVTMGEKVSLSKGRKKRRRRRERSSDSSQTLGQLGLPLDDPSYRRYNITSPADKDDDVSSSSSEK